MGTQRNRERMSFNLDIALPYQDLGWRNRWGILSTAWNWDPEQMIPIRKKVGAHLIVVHLANVTYFTNWSQEHPPRKRSQLTLLKNSLYCCGGLEPNLQHPSVCRCRVGSKVGLGLIPTETFKKGTEKRGNSRRMTRNAAKEAKENGIGDIKCYEKMDYNPR